MCIIFIFLIFCMISTSCLFWNTLDLNNNIILWMLQSFCWYCVSGLSSKLHLLPILTDKAHVLTRILHEQFIVNQIFLKGSFLFLTMECDFLDLELQELWSWPIWALGLLQGLCKNSSFSEPLSRFFSGHLKQEILR